MPLSKRNSRLNFQLLFGKWALAQPPQGVEGGGGGWARPKWAAEIEPRETAVPIKKFSWDKFTAFSLPFYSGPFSTYSCTCFLPIPWSERGKGRRETLGERIMISPHPLSPIPHIEFWICSRMVILLCPFWLTLCLQIIKINCFFFIRELLDIILRDRIMLV